MAKRKLFIQPIYFIIAWTIMSMLFGIQTYFFFKSQGIICNFWRTMFDQVPTFAIWAVYVPIMRFFLQKIPLLTSKRFVLTLLSHLLMATILVSITIFVIGFGRSFYYGLADETLIEYVIRFASTWFFYQYLMYTVMVMCLLAIDYYNKLTENKTQNLELQKLLLESQLSTLKMQLHPHFLFNTLNSISMLVRMSENKKANTVISKLGDLLRSVIESRDEQEVKLEKELDFVDSYLSIEVVRFGDMLSYEFDTGEDTKAALIPDMLIQPIVENCIKHGMKHLNKAMHIVIKSEIVNDKLHITITDDGVGFDSTGKDFLSEGIGLNNTIDRCTKMFGENVVLIESKPMQGTKVAFNLPLIYK